MGHIFSLFPKVNNKWSKKIPTSNMYKSLTRKVDLGSFFTSEKYI